MKLNKTSYTSIASVIQDALKKYASIENKSVVTDIYLQPNMQSSELSVFDDDDELLGTATIQEWENVNPEEFQSGCELVLKKVLNQMFSAGELASLPIMKPYSFVMVDAEKETPTAIHVNTEISSFMISANRRTQITPAVFSMGSEMDSSKNRIPK